MTERKPPPLGWDSWVERQIRTAQASGAFDRLPGSGRPLPDLDREYDPLWWIKKWLQREQLSVLPRDLALRKRVEAELGEIWQLSSEQEARRRLGELNVEIGKVNATGVASPGRGLSPFDIEAMLEEWRRRRSGREQDGRAGSHR